MPPLVLSPKFPTFPTYKISITLLLFSYVLERVASIQVQKYEKSVIYHSTITDFFDLQFHTSILSWLRYSDDFSELMHLLSEPVHV